MYSRVLIGLFQVPLRRKVQDGSLKSAILQALSSQEMLRDRNAKGVHFDRRREGSQASEDRGKPLSEKNVRCAGQIRLTAFRVRVQSAIFWTGGRELCRG